MSDYDLIVIGAGPGGYPAAIRASQLGLKVACVEKEKLGGVCLNWGCIPSKALLKTAELANKARHAEAYGLEISSVGVNYERVIARSRKVSAKFERGVAGLFKKYGVTLINGTATITAPGKVEVDGEPLTCTNIIVATGASARVFPSMQPDGERIVTYRHAIVRTEKPKRVIVLGAGAIGLEFAYFWHAMGVEVTVIEGQSEILPREDAETAKAARRVMEKSGIQFQLGVFVDKVERDGDTTTVTLQDGATFVGDLTLVAMGITPNTSGVGLAELGVNMERGFISIDDSMKTNINGIFAVGDCTTKGGLAHTATRQAEVCVERIAGHDVPSVPYASVPSCTYCQPQVASVGLTEEEATKQGLDFRIGKFPFVANGKATGALTPEGFVKVLLGVEHGEVIGAHIIGADATEMIAEFTLAHANELTEDELLHAIHAHPTYSEAMFEAVAQATNRSVHI